MLAQYWSRLSLPQAIAIAAAVLGAAGVAVFAPPRFWDFIQHMDWKQDIAAASSFIGVCYGLFGGKLLHDHPVRGPSVPPKAGA
jgi:hypothetical protein